MSDTGESRQSFIRVILEAAVPSFVLGDCILLYRDNSIEQNELLVQVGHYINPQ